MIKLIARKILGSKIKSLKRRVGVFNLKTAKTALIVYNATDSKVEDQVRNYARFLKEEGIKTDTIGFYQLKGKEDKKPINELGYVYLDRKDLNFFDFPKDNQILKLIAKEYNLLIDLNLNHDFCLEYISSLSISNFKVGIAESYKNEICDLTFDLKERNLNQYLKQITTYLKMINRN